MATGGPVLKCPNNHPYVVATDDAPQDEDVAETTCNVCDAVMDPSAKRLFCADCEVCICFSCVPENVPALPTWTNPDTNQPEPLIYLNEFGIWKGPQCVEDMIAVNFEYLSDEHRSLLGKCRQWAQVALTWVHAFPYLKKKCRRLLGTFQFSQLLEWSEDWEPLKASLQKDMNKLGAELDAIYQKQDLRTILGQFVPNMLPDTNGRQDCPGGLPTPAYFDTPYSTNIDEYSQRIGELHQPDVKQRLEKEHPLWRYDPQTISNEYVYIHFLRLIATALSERFGDYMTSLLGEFMRGNKFNAGPPKGYERMQNKLGSWSDHWKEEIPRPAENVDVVRGLAVFDDAQKMRAALEHMKANIGPFVKFKNGMAWGDKLAAERTHLRLILASICFTPTNADGSPMTFGDLCADPDVQQMWAKYASFDPPHTSCIEDGVVGRGPWHRAVHTALGWLHSEEFKSANVTMVCEVQMLLESYRERRHKMHEMYKAFRAEKAIHLHQDFLATSKREAELAQLKRDRGQEEVNGVWVRGLAPYQRLKRRIFYEQADFIPANEMLSCQENHQMQQTTSADASYADGWDCAICASHYETTESRHHCAQCKSDVCFLCEPVASAELPADAPFEVQMRSYMSHLQLLELSELAGLLCVTAVHGKTHVLRTLLDMVTQFEEPKGVLSTCGEGYHLPLVDAVATKVTAERTNLVNAILSVKVNVDECGGPKALWLAANRGYADACKLLLENGVSVDTEAESNTPLFTATYNFHADTVRTLIQFKADVNKATAKSASPLLCAAERGSIELVALLLQTKADPNTTKNEGGPSALYCASQNGFCPVVHELAKAKANPHAARTQDQSTPIYTAADKGYADIVDYLACYIKANEQYKCKCDGECACGINVLCQDGQWTPLKIAVFRGSVATVQKLLSLGVSSTHIAQALASAQRQPDRPNHGEILALLEAASANK